MLFIFFEDPERGLVEREFGSTVQVKESNTNGTNVVKMNKKSGVTIEIKKEDEKNIKTAISSDSRIVNNIRASTYKEDLKYLWTKYIFIKTFFCRKFLNMCAFLLMPKCER